MYILYKRERHGLNGTCGQNITIAEITDERISYCSVMVIFPLKNTLLIWFENSPQALNMLI